MTNHRFPEISKIILAILEARIEPFIGESAIQEIKVPYSVAKLEVDLEKISLNAENRLIAKHPDGEISQGLSALSVSDLPNFAK